MANATPPVKNAAFPLRVCVRKSDGTVIANPGGLASRLCLDDTGGAGPTPVVVDSTGGTVKVPLTATNMNADCVTVKVTATTTDAIPTFVTIYTAGQTFDSIYSRVGSVTASVWGNGTRTLSAFAFTPTPSNAADVTAILEDTGTTLPASIAALNDFDPATDTVARVTLVDTTTTNTDMRGTNNAATAASLTTLSGVVANILRFFTNKMVVTNNTSAVLYADDSTTPAYTQTLSDTGSVVTRGKAT